MSMLIPYSLRYLLLYQFGGVYLDTDVILLKRLPSIDNFVSVEFKPKNHLAAGLIKFEAGHPVLKKIMEKLPDTFSGSSWGANGPLMLEGVMREICNDQGGGWWSQEGDEEGWLCGGVRIFKEEYFYPVNWRYWKSLFDSEEKEDVMTAHRISYATHLWGHLSQKANISVNSPVGEIARMNCPWAAKSFQWKS